MQSSRSRKSSVTPGKVNWLGVTAAAGCLLLLLLGPLVLVRIQTGLRPVDGHSLVLWIVWKRLVYPHNWLVWTWQNGATGRLAHPRLVAWVQWLLVVAGCLWLGRSLRLRWQVALATGTVVAVGLLVYLVVSVLAVIPEPAMW